MINKRIKKQARSQEGAAIKPAYTSVAINSMGIVNNSIEYEPFGEVVTDYAATCPAPRLGWIGKERDAETGYGNFGVRNYDFEGGRFLSGDALWEDFKAWGSYHYSRNNVLSRRDPSGFSDISSTAEWVNFLASDETLQQFALAGESLTKIINIKVAGAASIASVDSEVTIGPYKFQTAATFAEASGSLSTDLGSG